MDGFEFILAIGGTLATLLAIQCVRSFREEWEFRRNQRKSMDEYQRTHPPISDREFLSLCRPDVSPEIALKVRNLTAEVLNIDRRTIYPDARFIEDLGGG